MLGIATIRDGLWNGRLTATAAKLGTRGQLRIASSARCRDKRGAALSTKAGVGCGNRAAFPTTGACRLAPTGAALRRIPVAIAMMTTSIGPMMATRHSPYQFF